MISMKKFFSLIQGILRQFKMIQSWVAYVILISKLLSVYPKLHCSFDAKKIVGEIFYEES